MNFNIELICLNYFNMGLKIIIIIILFMLLYRETFFFIDLVSRLEYLYRYVI